MTSCFVAWCFKVAGFTRCATVVANHSLHCATNLKNHHTESRIRYIKLDAWNAWQKDDIWLCCMMFSTHWPHKMCTVKPNIVCTVLPTWTTIKLIQEQGTSCFVAWCFKVAGFTRCATVVANHSLHCATNLKNHHTWSRKRYIKLDAWNAWQKDILLCCMMFQSRWLHKMCHRGSQSYFALCYQLEEPPHLVKKKVTLSLTLETLDKKMTSCFVAWCFKIAGFTRCATVVANHSLHCATNLKNHHTESRIRYIKLDAWNAWQKDDIWLCCMMFSTHWPHKMCTVKPNIVCTVLPTWTTIKLIQEQGTSCFVAWCFKVAGFTRCATVVANHSLHCATNLKNHHTWSRKRYIKLDAWNAWQKDDILLCCMMFQSRWLHKMCHRGSQSYFALCYQLEEPPHLVKKKVTLSLTLETLDKKMTSCFVAWCFKIAGFTRCATVVANHSLHCATNLKNHHTWSRKRYIKLDAWNAWQKDDILLCCMMFQSRWLHKMCHSGSQS